MDKQTLKTTTTCNIHLEKPAFFFEYSDKGIEKWGCSICSNKPPNHTRIYLDSIKEATENDIIFNWPPLKNQILYEKMEKIIQASEQGDILITKINEVKERIINKIEEYFEKLKDSLKFNAESLIIAYNQLSQKDHLKNLIMNKLDTSEKEISDLIKELVKAQNENSNALKNIIYSNFSQNIDCFSQKSFNEFENGLAQFIENQSKKLTKIDSSYLQAQIKQSIETQNYSFQSNIVIDENNIIKNKIDYPYSLGYFKINLNDSHFGQSFRVKIINLQSWIGIGVCNPQKGEEQALSFNGSNLTWCTIISGNGYNWEILNGNPKYYKSEPFKNGNIIQVTFQENRLDIQIFNQNNKPLKSTSLVIQPQLHDQLCPCFVIQGTEDKIQFLND